MFNRSRLTAVAAAMVCFAGSAGAQAIISNGTIKLGLNQEGHLNNRGTGLRFITPAREYESTAGGCACEGWGVGVRSGGTVTSWGGANESSDGGAVNLTNVSFVSTASTASSTVRLTSGAALQITHEYKPSSIPNLYEVNITITNTGATGIDDVVYRRVMDWDIEPTEFDENVRISGWGASNLIGSGSNGFLSAEPLSLGGVGCTIGGVCNGDFETDVTDDRGSFFDFTFGSLAAGQSRSFQTFYGAASSLDGLLAALGAAGVEVYTAAWCAGASTECAGKGGPAVFGYGFKGVGGTVPPELPPATGVVPEPSTYVMLGTGLLGLVGISRRRRTNA